MAPRRVTAFVQTDVTSWEDQLNAFKLAIAKSASHTLDVVVANAGISIEDSLFLNDGELPSSVDIAFTLKLT